jgi:hypothetical protein
LSIRIGRNGVKEWGQISFFCVIDFFVSGRRRAIVMDLEGTHYLS